ncbi:MAG: DUF4124 domain-containing protein [Burkholderiales bacterium]
MKKAFALCAFVLACGSAQAQIKCWNDANGKRVCGDVPPVGARPTTIQGTAPSGSSLPSPAGKSDAKKGPLTPAEQEQEYRKRKIEEAKAAEKSGQEQKEAAAKKANCNGAKEQVRNLESGQRQVRIDDKGERVFLDDAQVAQDLAKARQVQQEWCN